MTNLAAPTIATADSDAFIAELRGFDAFGAKTIQFEQDGIPYFVNEFWTSGQRQAHSLHEISYRACFKPQLPEFFISRLTAPGEGVYDPFMGRGTTPLQAALQATPAHRQRHESAVRAAHAPAPRAAFARGDRSAPGRNRLARGRAGAPRSSGLLS